MPVGPSPRAAPPIRFESVAISTSYPKLSTIFWLPNTARGGGHLPNKSQPIFGQHSLAPRVNPPSTDTPSRASSSRSR